MNRNKIARIIFQVVPPAKHATGSGTPLSS